MKKETGVTYIFTKSSKLTIYDGEITKNEAHDRIKQTRIKRRSFKDRHHILALA